MMAFKIITKLLPADTKTTIYDTSQIKSFNFSSGEIFDMLAVKMNNGQNSIRLFANLVVKGKASLYKNEVKNDDIYIISTNNTFYVLQDDKMERGESYLITYHYKDYLNAAFANNLAFQQKIARLPFNEKEFISIVSDYNQSEGSENKLSVIKNKKVAFKIFYAGSSLKSNSGNEIFMQAIYRTYTPNISKGASLNFGINFFQYYRVIFNPATGNNENFKSILLTLPMQAQYNFLNENIRPFVFGGLNLNISNETYRDYFTQKINSVNSFGIGFLLGGGIEANIFKGIIAKAEFRAENFKHPFLFGIGYCF